MIVSNWFCGHLTTNVRPPLIRLNILITIQSKRIERSYEQINKLTSVTQVSISYYYLNSKLEELALAYEYAKKKEQEKEELREQRQREREEKALQKEVAQKKKVIDKDITHYENVITELQEKLKNLTNDAEVKDINDQVAELKKNG